MPKAQAFGLKVIAYDPYVDEATGAAMNVEIVDFETLLKRSDYISVHVPMMPETKNLFGAEVFRPDEVGRIADQHRPRTAG